MLDHENPGHDHALDWWAVGVLLYEMIVGLQPFYHKNRNRMFKKIKETEVVFPTRRGEGTRVSKEA